MEKDEIRLAIRDLEGKLAAAKSLQSQFQRDDSINGLMMVNRALKEQLAISREIGDLKYELSKN